MTDPLQTEKEQNVRDLFDLSGRSALVTGAAGTGGFGRQIATALAEAGARVVITSRDLRKATARAEEMNENGLTVRGHELDLLDETSVIKLRDTLSKELGPIDILVNNSSDNCLKPLEEISLPEWRRVIDVNLTGAMLMSRAFAPSMLAQGRGVIINISSIYGVVAPDQRIYGDSGLNSPLVYGVGKAALIQMTRYLATYWMPTIRVNCITPGGLWNNQPDDFYEQYCHRTPLGRMAGRNDLKGAALFLASDASAWVTGENLRVDGGWTAW